MRRWMFMAALIAALLATPVRGQRGATKRIPVRTGVSQVWDSGSPQYDMGLPSRNEAP